jgi:Mg-chelatase subunit ChlD
MGGAGGAIKAGEWDDNANYREFQRYLGTVHEPIRQVDVRARRFLVVRDAHGKGVPGCEVTVRDGAQRAVTLTTTASGRAILFPRAEGLEGRDFQASARCGGETTAKAFSMNDDGDGTVDLRLAKDRQLSRVRPVDLAFVLDTTGSMSEEIASVKATIQKVAETLQSREVAVRIGLVEYKDRGDAFVTRVYPMSSDLSDFGRKVAGIQAGGGGDTPENMNAGLHAALSELDWNPQAVTRAAFVIGDAPPHLDYPNEADYAVDMRSAAHRGIQLFTIAASGMDALGQAVWRQMAAYTGATNMFVLRGGAGPQSTGAGDPKSSCGGTQTNYASGNLDQLIVSKIERELRSIDADPMRIPGLVTDEDAKPCDQRVVFWQ